MISSEFDGTAPAVLVVAGFVLVCSHKLVRARVHIQISSSAGAQESEAGGMFPCLPVLTPAEGKGPKVPFAPPSHEVPTEEDGCSG